MRCRMNFTDDTVQTQTPQFKDLGLSTINALDKSSSLGTPAAIIQRYIYRSYWSAPDHFFIEAIGVGLSAEKSDHDYNYKTVFQIWK